MTSFSENFIRSMYVLKSRIIDLSTMPCFRRFLSTFKNRICIQWYLYLIVFRVVLRKKDDKALRLWRVLFLGFFSIFPIHKSLCISWKHMKSARKRATALVLKSKRDDSIIDPLKKGILNCCCYCVVFSSCWPQAARGQVTAARTAHGPL